MRIWFCIFLLVSSGAIASTQNPRSVISLNGIWQIEEGSGEYPPTKFNHSVSVPGLVSLALPSFANPPGPKFSDKHNPRFKDFARDFFWYRRSFSVDHISSTALIKIHKAMFGAKVILNGKVIGEHQPNFTPGYFDAKSALRLGQNELIIRIGADPAVASQSVPFGFDFEKSRYIPGIFDSVELILTQSPHILNVQTAPEIETSRVRVLARLQNNDKSIFTVVSFVIREWRSGKVVGRLKTKPIWLKNNSETEIDVQIPIKNSHLWSPEDPFLYTLETDSGGDRVETRFGMRSFGFDPASGRAILNGKPYFMRGSNITLYRFFEDEAAGELPWDKTWVRKLHRRVKGMHWNSLRYCIGFPPEFWYDIADEEGLLIQDEYPIWYMKTSPQEIRRDQLALEYSEWMRERWNHPSVVIWDASNETVWEETTPALNKVRSLDLSNRPWDNSYSVPASSGDSFELHPYHFFDPNFKLKDLARASVIPQGNALPNEGSHASIINEYGWLWLNRDGSPTTLTKDLYSNLLGPNSTVAQRRLLYARYLAAETEFWRAHRKAAAVMHFTSLGYSRSDGQTSDHWSDVKKLQWEPLFYEYVRDAFAPTGLMIEAWEEEYLAGVSREFPVIVVNDQYESWNGDVRLRLLNNGNVIQEQSIFRSVEALGNDRILFFMRIPTVAGRYQLEAALIRKRENPVRSLRDFVVR